MAANNSTLTETAGLAPAVSFVNGAKSCCQPQPSYLVFRHLAYVDRPDASPSIRGPKARADPRARPQRPNRLQLRRRSRRRAQAPRMGMNLQLRSSRQLALPRSRPGVLHLCHAHHQALAIAATRSLYPFVVAPLSQKITQHLEQIASVLASAFPSPQKALPPGPASQTDTPGTPGIPEPQENLAALPSRYPRQ